MVKLQSVLGDLKVYGKIQVVDFSMSPYTILEDIDLIAFNTTGGVVEAILPEADENYNRRIEAFIVSGSNNAKLKTHISDYFETTNNYMIFYYNQNSSVRLFSRVGGWDYNATNVTISTGGTNSYYDALMGKASPSFRRVYAKNITPLSSNELVTKQWVESQISGPYGYRFYEREINSSDDVNDAIDAMIWFKADTANIIATLPQISSLPSGQQVSFRFSMTNDTYKGTVQPYFGDMIIVGSTTGAATRVFSYAELSNKYHYLELEKRLGENYWWVASSRRVNFEV